MSAQQASSPDVAPISSADQTSTQHPIGEQSENLAPKKRTLYILLAPLLA